MKSAPPRIPKAVTPKIYTAQYGQEDSPHANLLKPFYSYGITFSADHMSFTDRYYSWLSPDWWLIAGYKAGQGNIKYKDEYRHITEAEFIHDYSKMLNERYALSPQRFWDILAVEYPIVLCCYCKTGDFCHRHLLKEWLMMLAQSKGFIIVDGGELIQAQVTI